MKQNEKPETVSHLDKTYSLPPFSNDGEMPEELDEEIEYSDYGRYYFLSPECFNSVDGDLCFKLYGRDMIIHQALRLTASKVDELEYDFFSFCNRKQYSLAKAKLKQLNAMKDADKAVALKMMRDVFDVLEEQQVLDGRIAALQQKLDNAQKTDKKP